jgi:dienelactone hydrolase
MTTDGHVGVRAGIGNVAWARRSIAALIVSISLSGSALASSDTLGPYGPEGPRMREQLWLVPSGDPTMQLRATVFRPEESSAGLPQQRPLAVINHGTDELTRLSVSMPVYYWLSRWFVDRGYVVVIPQRRGHGATAGELAESVGTCENADHYMSGQIAADDIAATIDYMIGQDFVEPRNVVVVGISTGGWASLALASRNIPSVASIVNFAGGRGGHAYGQPNAICNYAALLSTANLYGQTARQPSIWLYSENDSYFSPEVALALAHQWQLGGGKAQTHIFSAQNNDGHAIADDRADWDLWGDVLDEFMGRHRNDLTASAESKDVPLKETSTNQSPPNNQRSLQTGSVDHGR